MYIFSWKTGFLHTLYRLCSLWLILFFLAQCFFPHLDTLAATHRQKMLRLQLQDIFKEDHENPRIKLMAQVLDIIPREHYQNLLKIDYNPYSTTLPRGMAKQDHLIINTDNIDSDEEFVSVFIHEIGHVTDLGYLTHSPHLPQNKTTEFYYPNRSMIESHDPSIEFYNLSWHNSNNSKSFPHIHFVSEYAQSNPFEDFAETYNFFVLHGNRFFEYATENPVLMAKYNFIKSRLFQDMIFDFYSAFNYPKIISDTTLLPFDLNKLVIYAEDKDDRRRVFGRTRVRRTGLSLRDLLLSRFKNNS